MKNLAIIQARTGSTRLPEKVLMKLEDKTVLEHVVARVKKSTLIDEVIVATTINPNDLKIVELCSKNNIRIFCGSENDVLDRYYQCAKLFKPENVIRVTADCPVIDTEIISKVIIGHMETDCDYTSNVLEETFPDGQDVEIFKYAALEDSWEKATLASEREHVTLYLRNNEFFSKKNISSDIFLGNRRWTLDNECDFELISKFYTELYNKDPYFGINQILELIRRIPDLEKLNSHLVRNEGLIKSIKNDTKFV